MIAGLLVLLLPYLLASKDLNFRAAAALSAFAH